MRSVVRDSVVIVSRWNSGSSPCFEAFSPSMASAETEFLRSCITCALTRSNASKARACATVSERRAVMIDPAACAATVPMNSTSAGVYGSPVRSGPISMNPVSAPRHTSGTAIASGRSVAVGADRPVGSWSFPSQNACRSRWRRAGTSLSAATAGGQVSVPTTPLRWYRVRGSSER
jgi:hypothetical protein